MAKKKGIKMLLEWLTWIVTVIIALGVGFLAIGGGLSIPYIPLAVMKFAGWFTVIITVIGAVLKVWDAVA